MNADKRRLKTKNIRVHLRLSAAEIGVFSTITRYGRARHGHGFIMSLRSRQITGFELLLCAVADVEDVHFLVFLGDAVDHTIDMGLGSIQ